jgi:predicted PurR-regulated permease PerM
MRRPSQPYIIRLAAVLISITLIVIMLYYLKAVIIPLLFAVIFAVMLLPFCMRLEKWGFSKGLAAFSSVLVTAIILGFLGYILAVQISIFTDQIPQLSQKLNVMINDFRDFVAHKLSMKKLIVGNKIQEQVTILQNSTSIFSFNSLKVVYTVLIDLFLIPLYIFFLIYYRHFFVEFFYKLFFDEDKALIDETVIKIGVVIKGYLFGQFLDIMIIGIANSIALYLIGVGYAVVLGFIISILCIIPYLGMIVGSLIALLMAILTTNTTWQPATTFAVLWIIHVIDSNILSPVIIGSRISINPLVAIFVLFLFGELWGLPGLFLALPLTAILKVIFDAIPGLKPYAFLLGTPEKYHFKKNSLLHIRVVQRILDQKKQKPIVDSLPDEEMKQNPDISPEGNS